VQDIERILKREPIAERGISVVVPLAGDCELLQEVLPELERTLLELDRGFEFIVVTSASERGGYEAARGRLSRGHKLHLLPLDASAGYGRRLQAGFDAARYPLIWQFAATGEYEPGELTQLLERIDRVDMVCGYRDAWVRRRGLGRRLFDSMLRLVFAVPLPDYLCPFRLFRRKAVRRIPIQSAGRFADAELLAKAVFMSMLIDAVPVTWRAESVESPAALPAGCRAADLLADARRLFRHPAFVREGTAG